MNGYNNNIVTGGVCYYHLNTAFVGQCTKCGKHLCRECWQQGRNGLCADCTANAINEKQRYAKSDIKVFKICAIVGFIMGVLTCAGLVIAYIADPSQFAQSNIPPWAFIPIGILMCLFYGYFIGSVVLGFKVVFRWARLTGGTILVVLAIFFLFITYMASMMIGIYGTPFILFRARKILKGKA